MMCVENYDVARGRQFARLLGQTDQGEYPAMISMHQNAGLACEEFSVSIHVGETVQKLVHRDKDDSTCSAVGISRAISRQKLGYTAHLCRSIAPGIELPRWLK
jgi:hypothetical protein